MKYATIDIETTGLNPLMDRITCIGAKLSDKLMTDKYFYTSSREDEAETLRNIWVILDRNEVQKIVGWNINEFDWKFLKIRSLINKVKILKYFHKEDRIDLMLLLKTDRRQKLDTYAKLLLNKRKGTENPIDLWNEKKIAELVEYNKNDVELTFDIFKQCVEYGLIQDE